MLTGKAKKDFEKWLHEEELRSDTIETMKTHDLFFHVIKWLDSLKYEGNKFYSFVFEKSFAIKLDYMTFFDVSKQAIEVCNNQYNKLKNNIK